LIVKYFPGGLPGFLLHYKEEIAAGYATLGLVSVIASAKAKKAQEEAALEQAKKPDTSSAQDGFTFSEPAGDCANG
jgi:hypothetical protein